MRIIGGTLRRTVIPSPPGNQTRPTMDSLRESVFDVLERHRGFGGARVLDLYAGSGILTWEALSRGAARAVMVDMSTEICRHLRAVATTLGVGHRVEIIRTDALAAIETMQLPVFDCVFADPPYARRDGNRALQALAATSLVSDGGMVVIEHGDQEYLLPTSGFEPLWQGARSSCVVDVLRCVRANP
ncbi:MAG: RsmD family RNA methyltransferase [Bacteroidota bacterium]